MQLEIDTPNDFSFYKTVTAHGWLRLLPFEWHDDAPPDWTDWRPPNQPEDLGYLERIEQLNDGSIAQIIMRSNKNRLSIDVDIDADETDIIKRVRTMLQLDIDIAPFHEYASTRKELHHIPAGKLGRLLRGSSLFEDTIKVIATANTTWAQTKGMVKRLCTSFGSVHLNKPTRYAFPAPEQIASVSFDEFADMARMGYRSQSVYKIATDIVSGVLDIEALNSSLLTTDELRKRLLSLPGIGPYGSACLMLYLGRGEHVNVDSWARTMVGRELGRPVTDKEVHSFFEQYHPWRGLVYSFYNWRD